MGIMNKIERAKLELPVVAPETKLLEPAKTATNSVEGTPSRKPSNAIPCSSKTAHYTCAPPKRNLMSSFQAASSHTVSASKRQQADVSSSAVPPVEHIVSRLDTLLMPDSPLVVKVRKRTGTVMGHQATGTAMGHQATGTAMGHQATGTAMGHQATGTAMGHQATGPPGQGSAVTLLYSLGALHQACTDCAELSGPGPRLLLNSS